MILRAVPLGGAGTPWPAGAPTAEESQRAAVLADPRRCHEFLAARLALRALVAAELGVDPARVRPAYRCPDCGLGEHGRPGFVVTEDDGAAGRPLDVAASLSRAGGWALLALEVRGAGRGGSAGEPPAIGVDLAVVADFRRAIPYAAYSPAERRRLCAMADAPKEAARLWARKESLLKALGTGLRADPAAVETLGDERVRDIDARGLGLPPGFLGAAAALG